MIFLLITATILTGDKDGGIYHPNPMPLMGLAFFLGILAQKYCIILQDKLLEQKHNQL